MKNNALITEAEKTIKKIVYGKFGDTDFHSKQDILQESLVFFLAYNKKDYVPDWLCRKAVISSARDLKIIRDKRTKKGIARSTAEHLDINDCYMLAQKENRFMRLLYDCIPNNASDRLRDVVAQILDGATDIAVAKSYGYESFNTLSRQLQREINGVKEAERSGQMSLAF